MPGPPWHPAYIPVTVGFLNYTSSDILELQLPDSVGAVSFEPGVQLDYWLHEDWHVYPYMKAGATFSSTTAVNALIYGIGVRSDSASASSTARACGAASCCVPGSTAHTRVPRPPSDTGAPEQVPPPACRMMHSRACATGRSCGTGSAA